MSTGKVVDANGVPIEPGQLVNVHQYEEVRQAVVVKPYPDRPTCLGEGYWVDVNIENQGAEGMPSYLLAVIPKLVACLLLLMLPTSVNGDGGIFRRQAVCPPHQVHHQQQAQVIEEVVALQQAYVPQAAPIVIQNNYPPVPSTVSSIYGYNAAIPQGIYNPFQVDPSEILREAARLTDRSQSLTSESLKVYQQLGTDALGQAGLVAQLQARTALIEASRPVVVESQSVVTQTIQSEPQRLMDQGENQTICLVPNGDGSYRIVVGGSSSLPEEGSQQGTVLRSKCAACHTGATSKASFVMFNDDGSQVQFSEEEKSKIMMVVKFNAMPPKDQPELTADERASIQLELR